jgi:radical SAM superfamily enzyme YgiQ (UPF0313 family)
VPDIVLTTLSARYAHASFALRYLMANLPDDLRARAAMLEFEISQRPLDVVEKILAQEPKIVGVGVYIWNARQSQEVVSALKRIRPDVTVIVGGPEVSYEIEQQEICRIADYVISGEADVAFGELSAQILAGKRPLMKILNAELPEFRDAARMQAEACTPPRGIRLPYDLYSDEDLAHRVVYVEASRGCPFKCEFCLSSLDVPVRNVPIADFLTAMQRLLDRGLRRFKFVDRTFNLNLNISRAILNFFLERYTPGLFLHFEMIPDRLPDALREPISRFPPGALQFEVGIQTFNEQVAQLISRRQDNAKVEANLSWLREHSGVHVHADLIAGLPGEDLESFGRGFDRLVALRPQEIQVGILKRLRGTPIVRHDQEWGMVYSADAPYEVLRTKLIDFATMQRLRRFARYWDLVANSGNFVETVGLLWDGDLSPFDAFMRLSEWLYERMAQTHAIALVRLSELVFTYLTEAPSRKREEVAEVLWRDYARGTRREVPEFLRPFVTGPSRPGLLTSMNIDLPDRQARHLRAQQQKNLPEDASVPGQIR